MASSSLAVPTISARAGPGSRRLELRPFHPATFARCRLALTVYLTQTLIFTTLFYGYGFAQAYRLGPAAVAACAVVIFAVQVVACQLWLKHLRLGPLEWLWRSLTYLK